MSADVDTSSNVPADPGPQEFLVVGQEPVVVETPKVDEPVKVDAKVAGLEEQNDENRDEKGRYKSGVQDRIDELTRARREAERESEYWKIRAQQNDAAKQAPAQAASTERPVRTDFNDDESYLEALADFKVEAKLSEREVKQAKETTQRQQVEAQTRMAQSWEERKEAARAELPDFDTVMEGADQPVAHHVAELIMEHDQGPKLMHHLAKHPEVIDKLNEMSPAKAAFELGKLATAFDKAPVTVDSSSKPAAKTVSQAPPPASRNVGAGRSTETPLGDQSMEDYIATRKAQGAGWAR